MFKWSIKTDITAQNAIFLEDNAVEQGRPFKARFLQAGLVKYDFGVCLLQKETIDKFVDTFVECPVIIDHKDNISPEDKKGTIDKIWFSAEDGWFWCSGFIKDDDAINLIENGYNVSCQYRITDYEINAEGRLHNGNPYDKEILNGVFEHLAIVKTPRYEGAFIAVNAIMADDAVCKNGGDGSGNFDHAGRPGEVGGSAPEGGSKAKTYDEKAKELEPIKIDSNNIPEFETKKELYEWVKEIFVNLGKVIIKDTGIEVILTPSSANRETSKRRSVRPENKAVYCEFKDVVEKSIKKEERKKDEQHSHNQEIYLNKFELDKDLYEVELMFDFIEGMNEYRYAGHKVNKIAPSSTQAINTLQTAGATNNSITDINIDFNPTAQNSIEKYNKVFEWIRNYKTGGTMDNETKTLFSSLIQALTAKNEADEKKECDKKDDETASNEKVDKRDIIRQIMAIAGKHEDNEDVRTIAKLAEKLAYDESEAGTADNSKAKNEDDEDEKKDEKKDDEAKNKCKNEGEKKLCDELKDKVDEATAKNSLDQAVNKLYEAIVVDREPNYISEKKGLELGKQIYG